MLVGGSEQPARVCAASADTNNATKIVCSLDFGRTVYLSRSVEYMDYVYGASRVSALVQYYFVIRFISSIAV
jgi:hypothetical protein